MRTDSAGAHPAQRDLTDRELIARHVDGDADAFGELFRRHRDRLWAVALRTLGDPQDAGDALQDAMVSAFRRASSYRGEAAVTTWLHRIVVNACLDRVRRAAVRAADPLPEDDRSTQVAETRDSITERQTAMDVEAALATLPPEQRAALVLVDMQGYPVQDVALMLDVAPGTVKSRCSRARAKLLPLLAQYGPAPGSNRGAAEQHNPDDPAMPLGARPDGGRPDLDASGPGGNRSVDDHVPPRTAKEHSPRVGVADPASREEMVTAEGASGTSVADGAQANGPDPADNPGSSGHPGRADPADTPHDTSRGTSYDRAHDTSYRPDADDSTQGGERT